MAMEHGGLGDYSIASLIWSSPPTLHDLHSYESVEEVKERLALATAQLQAAREEVGRKEQNIATLMELIRDTTQERDLVQEQHHLLLARALELEATTSSSVSDSCRSAPPLQSSPSPVAPVEHPAMFKPFAVPSPAAAALQVRPSFAALVSPTAVVRSASPALPVRSFAAIVGEDNNNCPASVTADEGRSTAAAAAAAQFEVPTFPALYEPSYEPQYCSAHIVENRSAAVAAQLEVLAAKRPLPQKGRLLQAVVDAGPLLRDLLVTGPLPRWRNPPPAQALTSAMLHVRPMREHKYDGGGLIS